MLQGFFKSSYRSELKSKELHNLVKDAKRGDFDLEKAQQDAQFLILAAAESDVNRA